MKILRLTAENVKRLKVVDITPKDDIVRLTGKNGQGKTSVLDSIWWALGGKDGIQDVPIRRGADKGRIRLDLGNIIVERTFTPTATTLTVRNAAGAEAGTPDSKLPRYGSPQEMLDGLIGKLAFDPLGFARKKPREQYDDLKRIAAIDIDLDALEAENAADFKRRAELNKEAKSKRAQAEAIAIPTNLPEALIDESALISRMQEAAEHNASIENRKARREQAVRDIADRKSDAARLRDQIQWNADRAQKRILELEAQIADLKREAAEFAAKTESNAAAQLAAAADLEENLAQAEPLPEPITMAGIRAELDQAKMVNSQIIRRDHRKQVIDQAVALEAEAATLTKRMQERDAQRMGAIAEAKIPIDGLTLEAGRVLFKGLPFEQSSDAEQLRVSMAIAMSDNPELRVIRIRDGSLLDEDSLAIVREMAGQRDFQVWMEQVDSSGKIGIVLEDGSVVSDNQPAAEMAL